MDQFSLPKLCRVHGNDAAEWSLSALSGCPNHWIAWFILGKRTAQISQKDQRLWLDSMLIQPVEAWTEVSPSAADGIEMNLLTGLAGLHLVYLSVEVQNVNAPRLLALRGSGGLQFKTNSTLLTDPRMSDNATLSTATLACFHAYLGRSNSGHLERESGHWAQCK